MTLVYVVLAGGLLVAVGLVQTGLKIRDVLERRRFTGEYLGQIRESLVRVAKHRFDAEANRVHAWLLHRGGKMQLELGADGEMVYREPFGGAIWPDYEVLTNLIPKLRDEQLQGGLSSSGGPNYDRAASVHPLGKVRAAGPRKHHPSRLARPVCGSTGGRSCSGSFPPLSSLTADPLSNPTRCR